MGNFGLGSSGAFLKASEHMQTSARNLQHATKDRELHIQLFKIPSLRTHTIQEKQILSMGQDFKNESEQITKVQDCSGLERNESKLLGGGHEAFLFS